MSLLKAWRRMMAAILPWAPRHERKAAIREAEAARERARKLAAHADRTAQDIKRIAYEDNHFAANIIGTLRSQGGRGGDAGPARR